MKPIPKKLFIFIFVFLLISGLFLFNVKEAKAGLLDSVLKGVFWVLLKIAQAFLGFVANIFSLILNFGFQKMDVVKTGWTITRDIVNMFFILGLIVIAFANILRIESYMMKTLLPKFIIVALLINFSYLACGLIIDATQIASTYFLDQIQVEGQTAVGYKDIGLVIADKLNVVDTMKAPDEVVVAVTEMDSDRAEVLSRAFSTAVMFLAGFVLLIGAILLFLRVGALWTLIILAPFAWFFYIFPKLKTHTDKWWSEFLKWAFFAPVYIFFIYLIITIAEEFNKMTQRAGGLIPGSNPYPAGLSELTAVPMFQNLNNLFTFAFLLVLLYGAPTVAMSMGIKAAGAVTTFTKGAFKGALKGAYKMPGRLRAAMVAPPGWMKAIPGVKQFATGLSAVAKWTTPAFWKKAWEERKKEMIREARVPHVIGRQQDLMNRVFSLGTRKTSHAEEAEQFEVAEKKKEIEADTKRVGSRLIARVKTAHKQKDVVAYKACLELLQEQGDTNDTMIFSDMFDEFKYDDKYALKELKGKNVNDPTIDPITKESNRAFTNLGFKHGVIGQMRQMGLSDKQIAPFLGKMQEIGLQSGYYGMYGMTGADEKGNPIIAKDEDQIKVAAAKVKTMTGRIRTAKLHSTAIGAQGADKKGQYKFAGREPASDAVVRVYTLADVAETTMQYVRPDTQTIIDQAHVAGALKEISAAADALGKKVHEAITGIPKKVKKEVEKEVGKTKEEVKKELEDLGLK